MLRPPDHSHPWITRMTVAVNLWHSPSGLLKQRQDSASAPGEWRLHMLCHSSPWSKKISLEIYIPSRKEGCMNGDHLAKSDQHWDSAITELFCCPRPSLNIITMYQQRLLSLGIVYWYIWGILNKISRIQERSPQVAHETKGKRNFICWKSLKAI